MTNNFKNISCKVQEMFKKHDLWLNDKAYANYMNCHLAHGRSIFLEIEKNIFDGEDILKSSFPLAPSLPRITAFGYLIGKIVFQLLKGPKEFNDEVLLNSAVFNNAIALFDFIYDELPEASQTLKSKSTFYQIDCLLNSSSNQNIEFNNKNHQKNLSILGKLISTFIINCRKHYIPGTNDNVWNEFKQVILKMYKSEISTAENGLSVNSDIKKIKDQLLQVNVVPAWAIALNVLLSQHKNYSINELSAKKEEICKLGSVFWPLDDLADIIEDLEQKRWSLVWLLLYQKGIQLWNNQGQLKSKELLIQYLLKENIIEEIALNLIKQIESLEIPEYKTDMLAWSRSWLQLVL